MVKKPWLKAGELSNPRSRQLICGHNQAATKIYPVPDTGGIFLGDVKGLFCADEAEDH